MKICKVKLNKVFNNGICTNIYPDSYNPLVMDVIAYDEKPLNNGNNVGYCIALVSDDFDFIPSQGLVEINENAAGAFIDSRASVFNSVNDEVKFKSRKDIITSALND